jgi:RNA polymerase sigma-70 factor (ECF subfamily)
VLRDHGAHVFRHALELLGSEADAEDVAQEVLLRAMRKLPTLGCDSFLRSWLLCATTSSALARRRKWTARDQRLSDAAEESDPPQRRLDERNVSGLIEGAVAGLPENCREVLVMADLDQMSDADIGRHLGLTTAAVKGVLRQARTLMRAALAPHVRRPRH